MKQFRTEERVAKIERTVRSRQHGLKVVMENIHDPHNVSAIFRTCDAAGVPRVSLLYNNEEFPKISKVSSSSAKKWVEKEKFVSTEECYTTLRQQGFKIYASLLRPDAVDLYKIDMTQKVAFVLGNEHRGVSNEAADLADEIFYIPMFGLIQSLNVSVANAVILYEAMRQRREAGMYDKSELPDEELERIINEWCEK